MFRSYSMSRMFSVTFFESGRGVYIPVLSCEECREVRRHHRLGSPETIPKRGGILLASPNEEIRVDKGGKCRPAALPRQSGVPTRHRRLTVH